MLPKTVKVIARICKSWFVCAPASRFMFRNKDAICSDLELFVKVKQIIFSPFPLFTHYLYIWLSLSFTSSSSLSSSIFSFTWSALTVAQLTVHHNVRRLLSSVFHFTDRFALLASTSILIKFQSICLDQLNLR